MTTQMVATIPRKRTEPELLPVVTLNNGQRRIVRRTPKVTGLVRRIAHGIIRRGGIVSMHDGEMVLRCHLAAGSAAFHISARGIPVAACYACWNAHINAISWETADRLFHNLAERSERLDHGYEYRDALPAPWVATVLLPEYTRISDKHRRWIAVLEPCAVWALWDNERGIAG